MHTYKNCIITNKKRLGYFAISETKITQIVSAASINFLYILLSDPVNSAESLELCR